MFHRLRFIVFVMLSNRIANNNTLPIPEFHGEEYEYWSIKMKTLLIDKGLWDIVEKGYNGLTNWNTLSTNDKIAKEAHKKNSFALYHLQASLDKSIFPSIASCTSTQYAWKACKEGYKVVPTWNKWGCKSLREILRISRCKLVRLWEIIVWEMKHVEKMKTLREEILNVVTMKKVLRTFLPK